LPYEKENLTIQLREAANMVDDKRLFLARKEEIEKQQLLYNQNRDAKLSARSKRTSGSNRQI
jgi:hypothetical protein